MAAVCLVVLAFFRFCGLSVRKKKKKEGRKEERRSFDSCFAQRKRGVENKKEKRKENTP